MTYGRLSGCISAAKRSPFYKLYQSDWYQPFFLGGGPKEWDVIPMCNIPHSWNCNQMYPVFVLSVGCTPLNTVPILFCVKAYSKNRHFRVFIMIKIGQTHAFLKDYVHIHQIGSHFMGGYRLDFSATGQEPRRSFCKLLVLGSPRLL